MADAPALRRPMTADEIAMGEALGLVRVRHIYFDRTFVAEMAACARDETPMITDRQAKTLRGMVHRYKKQLHTKIFALAGDDPFRSWPFDAPESSTRAAAPASEPEVLAESTPQLSFI